MIKHNEKCVVDEYRYEQWTMGTNKCTVIKIILTNCFIRKFNKHILNPKP